MKFTHKCPKCKSDKLWHIEDVKQPRANAMNAPWSMVVACADVDVHRSKWRPDQRVDAGTFETWVCAQCGFTEWYAKNANEQLKVLANEPDTGVHFVDGHGSQHPFR